MDPPIKSPRTTVSISAEHNHYAIGPASLLSPDFLPTRTPNRSPSVTQHKLTFAAPPEPQRQSLPSKLSDRSTKISFRSKSASPPLEPERRRSSRGSPPPSPYERMVSFDTFDNPDAVDYALTLRAKHIYYEPGSSARTLLFGFDEKDYSEDALEWLFEELIDDGDEIICLRVLDKDNKLNSSTNLESQEYRNEAHALMKMIQEKVDDEKSISLVLEFAVGKVQSVMRRMTALYEPTCLVVGTRGRPKHGFKNLLPGSISRDCLQNSTVPVLVIPPSEKREKKKAKRQAKPSRRSYMEIVERSDAAGSLTLSNFERGRSRNPHPTMSTLAELKSEISTLVSDTAIQPRREAKPLVPVPTPISSIPEEVEAEAEHSSNSLSQGPASPQSPNSSNDLTPTATPDDRLSPDLPILRVNSEDIF